MSNFFLDQASLVADAMKTVWPNIMIRPCEEHPDESWLELHLVDIPHGKAEEIYDLARKAIRPLRRSRQLRIDCLLFPYEVGTSVAEEVAAQAIVARWPAMQMDLLAEPVTLSTRRPGAKIPRMESFQHEVIASFDVAPSPHGVATMHGQPADVDRAHSEFTHFEMAA